MDLAHQAKQRLHPGPLGARDPGAKGQPREARPHQGRGVGHGPHAVPAGKEALQPLQLDPCQHRNQEPLLARAGGQGHLIELLGLDREQHHRSCPGFRGIGAHGQAMGLGQPGGRRPTGHDGAHTGTLDQAGLKQGKQQSLGHAAQANHAQGGGVVQGDAQIAVSWRPQAGLGAASTGSLTSRLTIVGEEASSLEAVVTVTQLGANRKMLSPTRS